MFDLLKTLCALPGPSGEEDAVRSFIRSQAEPYADEIRTDPMGNLMVFRKGEKRLAKPVMLCAHMDEVGVIVKRVTEDGMLKFGFVGGVDPRVVIGRRVKFGNVTGVVGIKAVHLTSASERKTMPKAKDLYIDIGASSKSDALARVELGQYGVFDSGVIEFGDGLLKAKAIDDRLGCAVLLTLLKNQPPIDTWFVFTVQEEVGLRGAATAAFALDPDFCLIVEGTTAADLAERLAHRSAACGRVRCSRSWIAAQFMTLSCLNSCETQQMNAASAGRPRHWLQAAPMPDASIKCVQACARSAWLRRCAISTPPYPWLPSPTCKGCWRSHRRSSKNLPRRRITDKENFA